MVFCEIVFSAFTLLTWIWLVNESKFSVADNARVILTLTVWQHLCSPCALAVQTSRAGPPPCLAPSVLGNPFSLPLSDRMWGSCSYICLLGCAASALVWSWWGFIPLLGAQPVWELSYSYHLNPHWAAEVAPHPKCWDVSRIHVAEQSFMGLPYQVGNATFSLSLMRVGSHRNLRLFS